MAPSSQSSDDEAPEAFSFNSQKKAAKGAEAAVQKHHAAKKQRTKEKNRSRDKALKERAARTKTAAKQMAQEDNQSKEGDLEQNELEARMARAMRDAEAESNADGSGDEGAEKDEEEALGSADEDDEQMDDSAGVEVDEVEDDESEGEEVKPRQLPKHANYLPDHLFEAAFSVTTPSVKRPSTSSKRKATEPPTKKRKKSRIPNKDVVVGSRTIRTLPVISSGAAASLRPTQGVNKFLKHSLNISGNIKQAKVRGWERRAANVGVMRTSGPAANFVRSS